MTRRFGRVNFVKERVAAWLTTGLTALTSQIEAAHMSVSAMQAGRSLMEAGAGRTPFPI